ncbi:nicotinate-nucleotide-dimethylbenzimidazole phosphoribosyltransferase [Nakamurella panacisegetis]|uniref:Nicotinate-nucleotide-dimethylbenzimidazole phosphoribosyltransferase n=1 Tax=Nakamurella panacisegetis TaxID=1090615 RepID=A0A1H0HWI1_9ACTN|nr:nicotinate-nucleotide--dimethylbenzimidazole phosphoribosyltransferase [Nakamurella panacisegetis]SDO23270.1 nicotinate-nucleotide-dimethylbenzimidazole phosphoribosyltransferase [Nakamurella panacisegetis]
MTVEFGSVTPPHRGETMEPHPLLGTFGPLVRLLKACTLPDRRVLERPRLVVLAGDHGIAARRVSAHPATETARRATDLAAGRGPVAEVAAASGVGVRVVDVAVDADLSDTGVDTTVKVRRSSGPIDVEDALSHEEIDAALEAGRRIADEEIDAGADLLIGSLCGVASSTATAVVVAGLTGVEPIEATSRGSGINDTAWIRKAAAVRDALYRVRLAGTDAHSMLRVAGGADLAALTGFIAQAAVRGVPVLVDDVASSAAALLANRLAPGAEAYIVITSLSSDRTHRRLLDLLGRDPLTAWSLRLGVGAGAVLLVPTIRAVARSEDTGDPDGGGVRTEDAIDVWDPNLF